MIQKFVKMCFPKQWHKIRREQMKRKIRTASALMLSAAIMCSLLAPLNVYAVAYGETVQPAQTQEIDESETVEEETGTGDRETDAEGSHAVPETQTGDILPESDENESDSDSDTEALEDYGVTAAEVKTQSLQSGESQIIRITLNDVRAIKRAVIHGYAMEKSARVQYEYTSVDGSALVFEIPYGQGQADTYQIDSLEIETEQETKVLDLSAYKAQLRYRVAGNTAGERAKVYSRMRATGRLESVNAGDGRFVVVLDPGHDLGCNDRGWVNGVWETELNWKIAVAMKKELEQYDGVEVYINREWEECPGRDDEGDTERCIHARIARAVALDADLVVSLHNNAAGMGSLQYSARGATVFVSQHPDYYSESAVLGNLVLDKLGELGIRDNGVKTRKFSDDGAVPDYYEDEAHTEWDYYGINRYSALEGIPSLLIEHAFMDNPSDLQAFLKNDSMLASMGQKDAQAIVTYYGLVKTSERVRKEKTEAFVTRLYEKMLGRTPDKGGLEGWTNVLLSHKEDAAKVVWGFVHSDEFKAMKLNNEDYTEILYHTCLNRESDENGLAAWADLLDGGFSRDYVLHGFIESKEFTQICTDYGIVRGNIILTENRDKNDQVTKFVRRCYNVFLDREPDEKGLNEWTGVILKNKEEARKVPYGFVFSKEMNRKNLSDEAFVTILYKGILDREPDGKGLSEWVKVLENGETRQHIFEGFVQSKEFTKLLSGYGL